MNTTDLSASYVDQCAGQFKLLAEKGHLLLGISIALAAAFAILSLVQLIITVGVSLEALRSSDSRQKMAEAGGASATPIPGILDSVKGLIGALAGAPAWFAVFLAGLTLIWMATLFTPANCVAPPPGAGDQTGSSAGAPDGTVNVNKGEKYKRAPKVSSEAGGR